MVLVIIITYKLKKELHIQKALLAKHFAFAKKAHTVKHSNNKHDYTKFTLS